MCFLWFWTNSIAFPCVGQRVEFFSLVVGFRRMLLDFFTFPTVSVYINAFLWIWLFSFAIHFYKVAAFHCNCLCVVAFHCISIDCVAPHCISQHSFWACFFVVVEFRCILLHLFPELFQLTSMHVLEYHCLRLHFTCYAICLLFITFASATLRFVVCPWIVSHFKHFAAPFLGTSLPFRWNSFYFRARHWVLLYSLHRCTFNIFNVLVISSHMDYMSTSWKCMHIVQDTYESMKKTWKRYRLPHPTSHGNAAGYY